MTQVSSILNWFAALAFIATTMVTLLGITGVIRVRDIFLKRLFSLLLLEIVAVGFIVIRSGWSPEQQYFREARNLMQQAATAREAKDTDRADQILGEVMALSVEDLPFEIRDVFLERGDIMFERKNWEASARSLGIYYEIDKNNLDALKKYGRSLREVGRHEVAEEVYQRAAQISPNDFDVLNGQQNNSRRLGAFYLDADRIDAANRQFEHTRDLINRMLNLAGSTADDPARRRTALLARARMFWEWRRYPEAVSAYDDVVAEHPDYRPAKEDLAAVYLEAGERDASPSRLSEARDLYRTLYKSASGEDVVYSGTGFAEAAALAADTTEEMLEEARKAVLTSLTRTMATEEDPYPHYAAAVLHDRLGRRSEAEKYLDDAIRYERRRASDPYSFDFVRLVKYERLQERWRIEAATVK